MTARLSPQRETEIRERIPSMYEGSWDFEWDDSEGARSDCWVVSYPTDHPLAGLIAEVPDYGEQIAEFIAHAREDVPALLAELAAVRAERDELQARSRRLVEQWNERAETWAPLSSPERNPKGWERYRVLCSAYCEAADNLHNVLNGIDPDVPWHLRNTEEASA